ncbi:MAG TPA: TonB-dependent receptor [Gemmatimonadales bacterium]|nr:TonB-dependent receptor [Gemmatimonadales bacterium]
MTLHRLALRAVLAVCAAHAAACVAHAQQRSPSDTSRADSLRRFVLEPVTVSVTRAPTDLVHVPLAVDVVHREEIARGRATVGIDEALITVPGVYVANRYNPAQDHILSIRGFGARSAFGVRGVKVLLDGIPQTLPDGQGQLSNVDLAEVGRIEVIRGPSSALYGNASGGVVSLWSDDAPVTHPGAALRTLAGSYGLLKWQARAQAPFGDGSASLTASETVSDGYRQHSEADTRRLSLRLSRPIGPRTRLTLHALGAHSPWLQDPGAVDTTALRADSTRRLANPRNLSVAEGGTLGTRGAGKDVTQGQGGLSLRHAFSGGGGVDLAVFGLRRELENQLSFAYIELDRWAWGGRAVASLPLSTASLASTATVGLDAQWQRDDRINRTPNGATLTRDQFERVSEIGLFAQMQAGRGAVSLTAGARYDRVQFSVRDAFVSDGDDSGERVMDAVSGAGGIAWDMAPAFQPYVSVATSFETPTTTELANRPTGPGGFNPELNPQTAVNYEVGVRGRVSSVGAYSVALYQAGVTNELIPFEVPGDPGRRYFRNAGSATHRGIEADVTLRLADPLALVIAYAYSDFKFDEFRTATATFDGNDIPGVPRHYLHWSVRYDAPASLWLAVDNTHASGYYVDDANTLRTGGWWSVGFRGGWQANLGAWRIAPFAGLLNATNQRYVGSVSVNAGFGRFFEPAPLRNGYIGLEISPSAARQAP